MRCPVDQQLLLAPGPGSLAGHQCATCAGRWFRAATMRQLAGAGTRHLERLVQRTGHATDGATVSPSRRCCPDCTLALLGYRVDGIEVELCGRCHGLWLDARELDAIRRWHAARRAAERGVSAAHAERRPPLLDVVDPLAVASDPGALARGGMAALHATEAGADAVLHGAAGGADAVVAFVHYVVIELPLACLGELLDGW
jgi:Zn-finger nucleic acid-binding protein